MDGNTLLPEQAPALFGQPLAARMRPSTLDEIAGQQHLLGPGKVLRRLISSDNIGSMIFWGPPGVGKTTLARVIALQTKASFIDFSAVNSGIKEIRQVMNQAEENRVYGMRTIVFVSLTRCCAVAGLGGKENRSGTFNYYIGEKIIDNDPKGVGPFVWASLEYERL